MILYRHPKRSSAGFTIFDVLVLMAACLPAFWVSSYFHGVWREVVFWVCYLVFGAGLWCFIFLWPLPAIVRHQQSKRDTQD
jgi:hypothetical protein